MTTGVHKTMNETDNVLFALHFTLCIHEILLFLAILILYMFFFKELNAEA